MPNLPISQLPELLATGLTTTAEFAVAQAGVTYRIKNENLSPFSPVYGLFTQTGTRTTVSGTSEQSIINGGTGYLTVGANQFKVGDTFHAVIRGHLSNNNDNMTIRVKGGGGSTILADTGSINYNTSADNVLLSLDIYFIIQSIGSAGSAQMLTKGYLTTIKPSNFSVNGYAFETTNNTTFDTTVSNTLDVTWQFDATDASTYVYSDFFTLVKLY